MLLHRVLDPTARLAFCDLACHVLNAAGGVTASEARVFLSMLAELELEVRPLVPHASVPVLAARITHPRARVATLLELSRLAHADGEFQSAERAIIEKLAGFWQVPEEELETVFAWAEQHAVLRREAEAIIDAAK